MCVEVDKSGCLRPSSPPRAADPAMGEHVNSLWVALPKNSAQKQILLNSICLRLIKALAHNLFHKKCEECF
jgi:hypothetical protein